MKLPDPKLVQAILALMPGLKPQSEIITPAAEVGICVRQLRGIFIVYEFPSDLAGHLGPWHINDGPSGSSYGFHQHQLMQHEPAKGNSSGPGGAGLWVSVQGQPDGAKDDKGRGARRARRDLEVLCSVPAIGLVALVVTVMACNDDGFT